MGITRWLLLGALVLGGCKGKSDGGEAKPTEGIVGEWVVDVDRLAEQGSLKEMPEAQRQLALEMARNVVSSMTFEFGPDTYSISMSGQTTRGRYEVKERTADRWVLGTTEGDGGPGNRLVVEFTDSGLLLHAGDDKPLPLRRKQ